MASITFTTDDAKDFDGNVFSIEFHTLEGEFHQNGVYALTSATIKWTNITNIRYDVLASIGGERQGIVSIFNTNAEMQHDFVINARRVVSNDGSVYLKDSVKIVIKRS